MRRQRILDYVLEKKSATVVELAEMFDVTNETIRRDLTILEEQGQLKRSHGGAFVQTGVGNLVSLDVRSEAYLESKVKIAEIARHFIRNGDAIFLDNSTTAFHIARAVQDMRLTVVTNSLAIINLLARSEVIRTVCTGGNLVTSEQAFSGNSALRMLGDYYVDSAFLSCRSLSLENGVTDSVELWTEMRQQIIRRSDKSFVVADYTKFDQTSYAHICDYKSITAVITDKPLGRQWHERLEADGCALYDGMNPA